MDLSEAAFADIHVVICIQTQFSDGLGGVFARAVDKYSVGYFNRMVRV